MLMLFFAACLSDIRPDAIKNAVDTDASVRGRAMLEAAAEAHGGLDAWNARTTVDVAFTDEWFGVYRLAAPWPDATVSVRHRLTLHTFDSELHFQGEHDGLVWGVRDWQTWSQRDGQPPESDKNKDARFILPTMHYFAEFPYRMQEAPVVLDAGPVELNGVRYQTLFVTWEDTKPRAEWDQYVLYINPDTGLIDKAHYTVREIARFVSGTMHFEDYRLVDGAWMSHAMIVTAEPGDPLDAPLHTVTVASYTFDPVSATSP